jgi:cytochrome P450
MASELVERRPGWRVFPDAEARDVAERFDLTSPGADFYVNPFPYYHALREFAPVKAQPDGSYVLTRYADLVHVYRDAATFNSDKHEEFRPKYGDTPLYEHHTTSLVFNDPPLHTRVRRIIIGALSPKAVKTMEEPLVALVDRLLDRIESLGEADLIADFASAIPVEVIGNLLGVPHAERGPLREWSLAILGALEPVVTEAMALRGNRAVAEFLIYLKGLVAQRRRTPGDPEVDVLTRLIRGAADGEQLTAAELLHNCIFLLNAGHETTTNLIGNGLHALLEWPEQARDLIVHPELIESAIEEFLRYDSSNQLGNRMTTVAARVGDVDFPAHTRLTLCIGSANRDPDVFPAPDRLDFRRAPNRHLAFATGPHQCAGLHLARVEARVAILRFVQRFPHYVLAGTPVRGGRARFRGFSALPVRTG